VFPIKDNVPSKRFPVMNWIIILANLAVFMYQLSLGDKELGQFFHTYGLVPSKVTNLDGEVSPLFFSALFPFLTNMFLHGGWFHFIGNMWTLFIFGDNVENSMGRVGYLLFYLLCGVGASFTHFFLHLDSTIPAIGASGAISGVMAAYMFLYPFGKIVFLVPILFFPLFFRLSAFIYIGLWFLIQLYSGTSQLVYANSASDIAFWAHIGGFGVGVLFHRLFVLPSNKRR
jgi:membrane associated rhomboid family serine protease